VKHKEAAVMAALRIVQRMRVAERETIRDIATYLEIPHPEHYEVATFYSMYELEETGRHRMKLHHIYSCMLRVTDGWSAILKSVWDKVGETRQTSHT
jgi:NADH-quinone oxidoreductase subunit E